MEEPIVSYCYWLSYMCASQRTPFVHIPSLYVSVFFYLLLLFILSQTFLDM